MSLTREYLKSLALSEEQIGAIIDGHAETVGALKKERDAARDAAREERERLMKEFEEYRAEVARGRENDIKRAAYRRLLGEARVPERFHERILRLADLDALELDGDRLRDEAAVRRGVVADWGDYVATEVTRGVNVDSPPAVVSPARLTVEQIMAISDDARREREIAVNHELFGF